MFINNSLVIFDISVRCKLYSVYYCVQELTSILFTLSHLISSMCTFMSCCTFYDVYIGSVQREYIFREKMNGGSLGILGKSCTKVSTLKPCTGVLSKPNPSGLVTKRSFSNNCRDKNMLLKLVKEQQKRTLMMLLNPNGNKLRFIYSLISYLLFFFYKSVQLYF